MRHLTKYILIFTLICLNFMVFGQTAKNVNYLRKGNEAYKAKDYKKSEIDFRKSLENDPNYLKGKYNLASSLYKQERYEEAGKLYEEVANLETDSIKKAKNLHNFGNSLLKQKKLEEAVKAYKNALKFNPKDKDTQYNLAYAQKLLQQNKQNQKNKDNKQQNKQDQKQDQKQNQQNKEDQQKQDQQKQQQNQQDKQKQDQQNKQQQGNKGKMDKKAAERMLQAMQQKEKNTKDKVDKQKVVVVPVKIDKDW